MMRPEGGSLSREVYLKGTSGAKMNDPLPNIIHV